jgi:hypothetical protein
MVHPDASRLQAVPYCIDVVYDIGCGIDPFRMSAIAFLRVVETYEETGSHGIKLVLILGLLVYNAKVS